MTKNKEEHSTIWAWLTLISILGFIAIANLDAKISMVNDSSTALDGFKITCSKFQTTGYSCSCTYCPDYYCTMESFVNNHAESSADLTGLTCANYNNTTFNCTSSSESSCRIISTPSTANWKCEAETKCIEETLVKKL